MAGKFIKGALVQFMETFIAPLPNVIIFQFNPETITHTWSPAQEVAGAATSEDVSPLAVQGPPGESFNFTLMMDATDQIAEKNPIAISTGIYSRIAALEMLLYPTNSFPDGLLGSVSAPKKAPNDKADPGPKRDVPQSEVSTVLFIWGPARILPVRVTSLTITEKFHDTLLNPTHAEAQIGLRVLTPRELRASHDELADIARGAYAYTLGARQVFAIANLANAVESIVGMIPI
jgi:hypothetical protein